MPAYPDDSGSGSEYEDEGMRPPRKRGRGGRIAASKRPRHDTMESNVAMEATLFEIVRQGKMAMIAVVDDWIEAYKTNQNESLLDLIQFFVNASGCKGTVTAQMLREATEGFQDVIKRMTEEFDEDSGDYPLIAAGSYYRKFRANFCDFVQALVRQCQYQIIYDQYMMDNVLTLLTELSNSQVRAFRHTSTLAAMKLMTGLVNVALGLSVSLDNTQRQYDAERNKALNKRASEKLDILLQKRKELEEQQSEIENMLNGIFKGIFVHRYRDYIADIRALCMEEIGMWMKMFPKVFLTDSYLKYVGWTLHDKQKEVRLKCLNTLIGLYGDTEMTRDLKLFTSRFKDRIVSMTLDKEYDVAVLAIKLLVLILVNCGYDSPVLTSGDSESVYQLVFSCHRPVATAAAEFLNKQLFADKDVNPGYTKRGRRRSPNAPLIADLVMFFIESELHEHATYLVDSLWEVAGTMLKDWECMSDMLLEEPANDRDALDERQESALVDIMVCSAKQAAEGVPPSGRQGYSKKVASRDRKTAIEDKVRLTEHFIKALPNLLKKFHVDKEKVTCLLQIPRYFDLEFYTTSRLEKHLDDLLTQMAVVVDKHTDLDVLEQASRTYSHLCDEDYAIYSKVSVARRAVIDTWVDSFHLSLGIFKEAGDDADEEEIYNVVQGLKRLTGLYMFNDLSSWNVYPHVNSILQMHQERPDSVQEPMLRQAVTFIYYDLIYGLNKVKQLSEGTLGVGGSEDPRSAISQLRQRVTEYLRACESLLTQSPHKKVQEECYMTICDLLVMFAPQLANSSPTLKPLVQRASETLQHALIDFVKEFVFVVTEEDDEDDDTAKIDALHRRRSLLANVCKLFVFCMMDLRLAAYIFQQYIRFYSDYGDIIKETISRSRHIDKLSCAKTLALSLMTLYQDTVREQGGHLDYSSQDYAHMKELARRFALTFGLDQVKTRDAVAELHKEGILFALRREDGSINEDMEAPPSLSFLGILVEFSAKLMKQDKKTVVQYLDRRISPRMLSNQAQAWIPLVTYRNSLLQGADDDQKQFPSKGRRGRRRKVDGDFDAPQTPRGSETPLHQPQTPMTPQAPMTPQSNLGHPQLSSTIVRGISAPGGEASQIHMQDDSAMQYQPGSLRSWLNSGAGSVKPKPKSFSSNKMSGRKKQVSVAVNTKPAAKPKAKKTIDHRSEDEGFVCDKIDGFDKESDYRRSTRKSSLSAPTYAENSDDDFYDMPPATWGSCREVSQSDMEGNKETSKVDILQGSLEDDDELEIGEFEDDEIPSQPEKFAEVERSELNKPDTSRQVALQVTATESPVSDVLSLSPPRLKQTPKKRRNQATSNPFAGIVSKVKEKANTSLAEMLEEAHISDVDSNHSSGDEFESNATSYYQTPEKRRRRRNSSSDSGVLSSPLPTQVSNKSARSRRKISYDASLDAYGKIGTDLPSSTYQEESEFSVDEEDLALQLMQGKEEIQFRKKEKNLLPDVSIFDAEDEAEEDKESPEGGEDDFGVFNDVMQSFFMNVSQRSQDFDSSEELVKGKRAQTIVNNPMGISQTPQHSMQSTQDFQQMHVGYPMSVPQASPMPQMGTPQHPPPQYMHGSTSTGMYHQGTGDPFQGVMSPMQQQQQQGMQSQQQYFGN